MRTGSARRGRPRRLLPLTLTRRRKSCRQTYLQSFLPVLPCVCRVCSCLYLEEGGDDNPLTQPKGFNLPDRMTEEVLQELNRFSSPEEVRCRCLARGGCRV